MDSLDNIFLKKQKFPVLDKNIIRLFQNKINGRPGKLLSFDAMFERFYDLAALVT
jgi:hypothetical protein